MTDWKKYKLGEIIDDIAMGPFGSNIKVDNFIPFGVPVIRGQNLNEGEFENYNKFVFISEEKAQTLKRCLAYVDDLVFTKIPSDGELLTKEMRDELVGVLTQKVTIDGIDQSLLRAMEITAQSLVTATIQKDPSRLLLPIF